MEKKTNNNWASLNPKEFEKVEIKEYPEEKPKRTASERKEEVENLRAQIYQKAYWETLRNGVDYSQPCTKPKVKPYGRLRSYLMDNKTKVIYALVSSFLFLVFLGLMLATGLTSSNIGLPVWLLTALLLSTFGGCLFFTILAVEVD